MATCATVTNLEEDVKIWPLLKRLQAVERWWQTSVRRRPYDWFIYSSFD